MMQQTPFDFSVFSISLAENQGILLTDCIAGSPY
jgi:hypothetical protein